MIRRCIACLVLAASMNLTPGSEVQELEPYAYAHNPAGVSFFVTDPVLAIQGHLIYTFRRQLWLAFAAAHSRVAVHVVLMANLET